MAAAGKPPSLREVSEQFRFEVPGEADVMLRIMESDPRMPRFFTRAGGVSEGAFASLNCGFGSGDAPDKVAESRKPGARPLPSLHSPFYLPEPGATIRTGVTSMTAAPWSLHRRLSSEMIWAWIDTSSAVVGSSARMSRGLPISARAIATRCF